MSSSGGGAPSGATGAVVVERLEFFRLESRWRLESVARHGVALAGQPPGRGGGVQGDALRAAWATAAVTGEADLCRRSGLRRSCEAPACRWIGWAGDELRSNVSKADAAKVSSPSPDPSRRRGLQVCLSNSTDRIASRPVSFRPGLRKGDRGFAGIRPADVGIRPPDDDCSGSAHSSPTDGGGAGIGLPELVTAEQLTLLVAPF